MKRDANEKAGRQGGPAHSGFGGTHVGGVDRDGAGSPSQVDKIRPAGVVPQGTGPTFTCNDPIVGKTFGEKRGKTEGKFKPSYGASHGTGSTVVTEKTGPTLTVNKPALTQPYADVKPVISKQIAEEVSKFRPLETAGELTATQSGSGGPTDHPYFLSKEYDKKGAKSSIGKRVKPFEGA
jgi:hypothetical protein